MEEKIVSLSQSKDATDRKAKSIEEEKKESLNNKSQQKTLNIKPKKNLLRRKSLLKRKLFEKPEFIEQVLDKGIIKSLGLEKTNPELYKILILLTQSYNRRITKENELIFSFLTKIKMNEIIKSDLLETNFTWEQLFYHIKPFIFGKICDFYDTLYYTGNESNLLYIVINGKIGRYNLIEFTKSVSCEKYLLFICDCYLKYQKMLNEGPNEGNKKIKNKNNEEEDEEDEDKLELKDDEYIDEYLLKQIIEKNKEIYSLHAYEDIDKLKSIIFKIKLLSVLSEGKSSDAIELYEKYRMPIEFLGYNRVIERQMTPQMFLQKLNRNLGSKGRYYMKQLGLIPQKVKVMKFVKKDILTPYNFFGNFEIIDCEPKRQYTTRCESERCILICIDKKMYSSNLYEMQKEKRDKEIATFHTGYIFKNINIHYFTTKIFSNFKIRNLFKGDTIFNQEEKINNFVLVKEGIIELSLENISFFELNQLIKKVRDILIIGAKKYRIDFSELFNFNMNIDSKTSIKFNIIKEVLHKKQSFIFSRSQKGFFGEYELFFGIPALLTGTVMSDTCKVFYYDFNLYKNLNEDTYILNESLKQASFFKLKTILKRLINLYNSYWKRCHDLLNKKEIENEEMINIKNNEEMELANKKTSKLFELNSPFKINPNIKDIFMSCTLTNNLEFNISKDDDFENILKLYLNNNNNANSKFFRTSLDNVKSKIKLQNLNKNNNNISTIKESQIIDNNPKLKTLKTLNSNIDMKNVHNISIKKIRKKYNDTTLLREFKNTIEAQRKKSVKKKEKIFLPPIIKVPKILYNYPIFKTEIYKNNNNYDRDDNSINKSIEISKDKSIDKSKDKLLKSIQNSPKIKERINKIKRLKTLSLKVAQFNSIRYRMEKIHKRNPKLYRMNASYSK